MAFMQRDLEAREALGAGAELAGFDRRQHSVENIAA